ncbi:MAG TPA: sigma-70 family RNA polymerase sigma factor [Longilinea sp.]|nr:sigma-70 family RNA polymerase sigma factor [Longilinea sp.]
MDEAGLIAAARLGDLDAFNHLVMVYQSLAYNLAVRLLNDLDAADDATQTAFLSAFRHLDTYRGGSFRAWVMRMVTNTCYDELRRLKRHPQQPLEPMGEDDNDEIESPYWMADESQATPEMQIEQRDLENAIQHCLHDLPDEFRSVVVMVDVEGLDYEEVAQAVSKPLGTVKSRLSRARLRMRDCLQGFTELLPSIFRQDNGV